MANSLLAHLYSRIRGSQEDVATLALQYLLSQSTHLNKAFTHLLEIHAETTINEDIQYLCQSVGEEKERPDMSGTNKSGTEVLLCEMKFYASLTPNQPLGYIDRLKNGGGKLLTFICPKSRQTSLWTQLKERSKGRNIQEITPTCISVDGIYLSIITWAEIIERLQSVASVNAPEFIADIKQLEGYCAQMDSDAFIPFAPKDLSAENAIKYERYYEIIDETIELLCADISLSTSKNRLKATAYRRGYTRSLYIDNFTLSLNYDRDLWKSNSSVETPFWVAIRNENWDQTEEIKSKLLQVPPFKKEDKLWGVIFVALIPLTDATLDEVCEDLKRQIIEYLNLFR